MSEFSVFLDDSGSPDEGICLGVGGFVSTWDKWIEFEKAWHDVLEVYDISYFHMREYAHSTDEFKNWKGKEGKRRTFLKRLVKCLNGRVHKSFASSVTGIATWIARHGTMIKISRNGTVVATNVKSTDVAKIAQAFRPKA